jgi:hypothetical protein
MRLLSGNARSRVICHGTCRKLKFVDIRKQRDHMSTREVRRREPNPNLNLHGPGINLTCEQTMIRTVIISAIITARAITPIFSMVAPDSVLGHRASTATELQSTVSYKLPNWVIQCSAYNSIALLSVTERNQQSDRTYPKE